MLTNLSPITTGEEGRKYFTLTYEADATGKTWQETWFTNKDGEGLFYDNGKENKQTLGTLQFNLNGNSNHNRATILHHFLNGDINYQNWLNETARNHNKTNALTYYREHIA